MVSPWDATAHTLIFRSQFETTARGKLPHTAPINLLPRCLMFQFRWSVRRPALSQLRIAHLQLNRTAIQIHTDCVPVSSNARLPPTADSGDTFKMLGLAAVPLCRPSPIVGSDQPVFDQLSRRLHVHHFRRAGVPHRPATTNSQQTEASIPNAGSSMRRDNPPALKHNTAGVNEFSSRRGQILLRNASLITQVLMRPPSNKLPDKTRNPAFSEVALRTNGSQFDPAQERPSNLHQSFAQPQISNRRGVCPRPATPASLPARHRRGEMIRPNSSPPAGNSLTREYRTRSSANPELQQHPA